MQVPEQGIARLNHFVVERRHQLHISRTQMFTRGGPSPSTMQKALTGSRGLSRSTLERIDRALGWTPGSAQEVMRGGTPTSQLAAPDDAHCEHVITVLQTLRTQLQAADQLVADLLGPSSSHAR